MSGSKGSNKYKSKSKLDLHANTHQHLNNVEKWRLHVNSKMTGTIHTVMSNAHREQVLKNRNYIKTLIDIILFLTKQGLALRGHRENDESLNHGKI